MTEPPMLRIDIFDYVDPPLTREQVAAQRRAEAARWRVGRAERLAAVAGGRTWHRAEVGRRLIAEALSTGSTAPLLARWKSAGDDEARALERLAAYGALEWDVVDWQPSTGRDRDDDHDEAAEEPVNLSDAALAERARRVEAGRRMIEEHVWQVAMGLRTESPLVARWRSAATEEDARRCELYAGAGALENWGDFDWSDLPEVEPDEEFADFVEPDQMQHF